MKEKRLYSFEYLRYAPLEDLPEAERRLANCAAEACSKSYAPYSDFRVGAAALLDDGEIVSAANQESEVFPSGMCAERSLLYYVQSNRSGRKVRALAIASLPASRECSPCGACRQVIDLLPRRVRYRPDSDRACDRLSTGSAAAAAATGAIRRTRAFSGNAS